MPTSTTPDHGGERGNAPSAVVSGRTRLVVVLVVVLWTVTAGYVAHSLLPAPVLELPGPAPRDVRSVLPQGWAFFTKDVRDDRITVLHRAGTAWEPVRVGPGATASDAFGARRGARTRLGEITALAAQIRPDEWLACDRPWAPCADRATPVLVENRVGRPSWCGRLALVEHEPVPWAWAAEVEEQQMPARAAVVDAACG